ncbi:F-box protein-like protein [Salvia divinorum]|uniref:F-box protein-like protein n=1 Tax=Salvia divinorum TaxID=28513 RepID=A0ABD1GIF0_SALDI
MRKEFFANLPLEITTDILSRLPPRAVVSCKCVCQSWLKLLNSNEFVKSHLSKSVPGMAVVRSCVESNSYEIFEFEDSLDLERHHLRYSLVTKFAFPFAEVIRGSANGLLFLTGDQPCDLYICNPITRHYIKLRPDVDSVYSLSQIVAYGFGVTRVTGQHKVVRIVYDYDLETEDSLRVTKSQYFVLFYYSDKRKTTQKIEMFEARGGNHSRIDAILHTPSFLSLRGFGMEDVNSF